MKDKEIWTTEDVFLKFIDINNKGDAIIKKPKLEFIPRSKGKTHSEIREAVEELKKDILRQASEQVVFGTDFNVDTIQESIKELLKQLGVE
jgi:hypothetical protein